MVVQETELGHGVVPALHKRGGFVFFIGLRTPLFGKRVFRLERHLALLVPILDELLEPVEERALHLGKHLRSLAHVERIVKAVYLF